MKIRLVKLITAIVSCSFLAGCGSILVEEGDDFGKDIVSPPNMKVNNVIENGAAWGKQQDPEMPFIDSLWTQPTQLSGSRIENVDLPSFGEAEQDLLVRHLSTSCKWRVTDERGAVVAIRRSIDEHGNWTGNRGFRSIFLKDGGHAQMFTQIVLSTSKQYASSPRDNAVVARASAGPLELRVRNNGTQGNESNLTDQFGNNAVEIFEQSPVLDRRFTQAELRFVKTELDALRNSEAAKRQGFDRKLVPEFSIRMGEPALKVLAGMQGGIYGVEAFVNPGESGKCFLRVFEATRNTPLSEARMRGPSTEYTGWSDNPKETFFYSSEIIVYEGDWGNYYPARFELWFEPADKSKPKRKLIEDTYKICGWMR